MKVHWEKGEGGGSECLLSKTHAKPMDEASLI